MTIETIKEALKLYERHATPGSRGAAVVAAARQEVEELEAACKALEAEGIGDKVYDVRNREMLGWDGPRVTAWGNAAQLITTIAKEAVK